jgi:hypothetical protein
METIMEITLTSDETALLIRILTDYLSDLRAEIAATDSYDLRTELHKEEILIRNLLTHLQTLS